MRLLSGVYLIRSTIVGNKMGWILAAVLVLAISGFITKQLVFPSPSSPTAISLREDFLMLQTHQSPVSFLVTQPEGTANAGDDYATAVALFDDNSFAIGLAMDNLPRIRSGAYELDDDVLQTLNKINEYIAEGAKNRDMQYVLVHTEPAFEVKMAYRPALALYQTGECLSALAGWQVKQNDHNSARATLENMLILGWHMTNERARADMVLKGLDLQASAGGGLRDLYQMWDKTKYEDTIEDIDNYLLSVKAVRTFYIDKWKALITTKPQPGDLYRVVEHDKDPAWRVDALLFLGAVRYTHASHRGDMRYTNNLLEHYSSKGNTLEKAAAKAAASLDRVGFNTISLP